jgi:hypothetical protein
MLYEVKYGLSLRVGSVIVDPIDGAAADFDLALGGLHIGYYAGAGFHAEFPAGFSGNRTFTVTGVAQGAWTVTPSGPGAPAPFPASVGADGTLTFTAPVGPGLAVDAAPN